VSERAKTFIQATELRTIVSQQVGPLCGTVFSLYVSDNQYYCPPVADVQKILSASKVAESEYIGDPFQSHDCDDFSHLAMAAFIRDAYRERERRPAYAFGMVFSLGHAFNWFMGEDKVIRLVEPQTGEISDLEFFPQDDCITFMLV